MKKFLTPEALVAAYWRKLTRPIGVIYKDRGGLGREAALSRKLSGVGAARRPYHLRPHVRAHS